MRYMVVAKTFFVVLWGIFAALAAYAGEWDLFAMFAIGGTILGCMPENPL